MESPPMIRDCQTCSNTAKLPRMSVTFILILMRLNKIENKMVLKRMWQNKIHWVGRTIISTKSNYRATTIPHPSLHCSHDDNITYCGEGLGQRHVF